MKRQDTSSLRKREQLLTHTNIGPTPHFASRHRWEQNFTVSQSFAHFFRQTKGRPQTGHILDGSSDFLRCFGIETPLVFFQLTARTATWIIKASDRLASGKNLCAEHSLMATNYAS